MRRADTMSETAEPAVFERSVVMERFAGNGELFSESSVAFIRELQQKIARLEAAVWGGDLYAAGEVAHIVEERAGSMGARALEHVAARLGIAARDGDGTLAEFLFLGLLSDAAAVIERLQLEAIIQRRAD